MGKFLNTAHNYTLGECLLNLVCDFMYFNIEREFFSLFLYYRNRFFRETYNIIFPS